MNRVSNYFLLQSKERTEQKDYNQGRLKSYIIGCNVRSIYDWWAIRSILKLPCFIQSPIPAFGLQKFIHPYVWMSLWLRIWWNSNLPAATNRPKGANIIDSSTDLSLSSKQTTIRPLFRDVWLLSNSKPMPFGSVNRIVNYKTSMGSLTTSRIFV